MTFGESRENPQIVFRKNPSRFIPIPVNARKRHLALAEQLEKARELAEKSPFNKITRPNSGEIRAGIISSGPARNYTADAIELEDFNIAHLELGQTWPLPENLILNFIKDLDSLLILEEGEPILEKDIRELAQKNGLTLAISGKDEKLNEQGEYSARKVRERIRRWLNIKEALPNSDKTLKLPVRPPNLCPGCAHRSVYYAVRKIFGDDAIYSSDIGCYTLGILPPLRAADFLVCMGSSVTAGAGMARVSDKPVIAFIGDSTFFHSGISGLANAVFNNHDLLVIILDNGTTAMTGHQPNPGMDHDKLHPHSKHLHMEKILEGLGIEHIQTVKAHNIKALSNALEQLRDKTGVRVLIAKEPCLLYAKHNLKKKASTVAYVKKQGESAEQCVRDLACPAFVRKNGNLEVDPSLCGSCMVCIQIAPDAFAAKKRE